MDGGELKIEITEDNTNKVLEEVEKAIRRSLEIIGLNAEKYAKAECKTGTSESTGKKGYRGGTLKNSITHTIDEHSVMIGSNVEYAPFVELGTGPYFTPPPEWEHFQSKKGFGIGHGYVKPRPYLRPAIEDHLEEYRNIIKSELE